MKTTKKRSVLLILCALLVGALAVPGAASVPAPSERVFLAEMRGEPAAARPAERETSVELMQNEINPGETLVFTLRAADRTKPVKVQNEFGFAVRFTPVDDGTMVGFLPLSYFTQPGAYTVTVSGGGLGAPVSFSVRVKEKQFALQQLTVDEGVANSTIFNDEASKEYRSRIWPLKELYDDEAYFDGRFIKPLDIDLVVTTEFGFLRTVNGKPNPRHDGVDLSAATGTPVRAAQNGRVLFADFVKLTGNTIVIEHGAGLKSWYQHMDTLNVKEGDRVKTGDLIGAVGATGFVTGPHLHFSASINGVFINPFTLVETDLLDQIAAANAAPDEPD